MAPYHYRLPSPGLCERYGEVRVGSTLRNWRVLVIVVIEVVDHLGLPHSLDRVRASCAMIEIKLYICSGFRERFLLTRTWNFVHGKEYLVYFPPSIFLTLISTCLFPAPQTLLNTWCNAFRTSGITKLAAFGTSEVGIELGLVLE